MNDSLIVGFRKLQIRIQIIRRIPVIIRRIIINRKINLEFEDNTRDGRYDEMMKDFYAYIIGTKKNPFSYEHDYMVQKVIDEVVGGVEFFGKNID